MMAAKLNKAIGLNSLLKAEDFKSLSKDTSLVLLCHQRPDGDALGSLLGLGLWLRSLGLSAHMLCPDAYPKNLSFLPQSSELAILEYQAGHWESLIETSDLLVLLDHSRRDRGGESAAKALQKRTGPVWMIDHHPEPEFFDKSLHRISASSTCELVCELLNKEKLNTEMATALMCGLLTDTGGFKHAVRSETFLAAARLLENGVNYPELSTHIFDTNSLQRLKLTGFALKDRLKQHPELPLAWMVLNHQDVVDYKIESGDTEGLVNYALSIAGNKMGLLFQEKDPGITRISFRSKGDWAVNQMAERFFSGGGHKNAAGGRYEGTAEEAEAFFLSIISDQFA